MRGLAVIDHAWVVPLRKELRLSLKRYDRSRIDDLARRTLACVPSERLIEAAP